MYRIYEIRNIYTIKNNKWEFSKREEVPTEHTSSDIKTLYHQVPPSRREINDDIGTMISYSIKEE